MDNYYRPWEEEGITELAWWKRMYLHQSALAQQYEIAMRQAIANIKASYNGTPLIFGALTQLEWALEPADSHHKDADSHHKDADSRHKEDTLA